MKVAICLAGNLRRYEKLQLNWLEMKQQGMDLFLSTWDFRGCRTSSQNAATRSYHDYNYNDHIVYTRDELLNTLGYTAVEIDRYYPTFHNKFETELEFVKHSRELSMEYDPYTENNTGMSMSHHIAFLSMWYKRWRVFELMHLHALRHDIKYDLVMIGRPDIFMQTAIGGFDHFSLDKIYIPCVGDMEQDFFAIGSFDLMREYAMLYPRFDFCCKRLSLMEGGRLCGPSNFMMSYINGLHLPYERYMSEQFTMHKVECTI
jgi:hypothetical protein